MIQGDFLAIALQHVLATFPALDVAQLRTIEMVLREELGGERHYIARPGREDKAERIRRELEAGATMAQAARAAGVSLRHCRRLAARAGCRRR